MQKILIKVSEIKMKLSRLLLVFIISLSLTSNVSAFGIKTLTKNLTGGGDSGGVDVKALTNDQSSLLKQVSAALLALAKSQALMSEALGLKEQAAIASQNAASLEAGELTGKDDMEKQIASSQEVSDAIQAKIEESEALTAKEKETFAKSLPPYGVGSIGVIRTSKTAIETSKSVLGSKDLTVLSKLGPLLSYAKKAPSLISNFTSCTSSVINFSKKNEIDTSELEEATKDW